MPEPAKTEHEQVRGTAFDWTLVRDDHNPDKTFWPHYQKEMDIARKKVNPRTVEKFLQHEHFTRRAIQVAKPYLNQVSKVRIQALPCRVRVGPFVRYTDHERAVICRYLDCGDLHSLKILGFLLDSTGNQEQKNLLQKSLDIIQRGLGCRISTYRSKTASPGSTLNAPPGPCG